MNEVIQIKANLNSQLSTEFAEIDALFAELQKEHAALSGLLEKSEWTGQTNRQCILLHSLTTAYEQSIYPIYVSFKKSCSSMLGAADDFCADSRNVTSLKNW